MKNKVIRTICYFNKKSGISILNKLKNIIEILQQHDYEIQTKRICIKETTIKEIASIYNDPSLLLSVGSLNKKSIENQLQDFYKVKNVLFNYHLLNTITIYDVNILFEIIKNYPENSFHFAFTFNNIKSSPYLPSADYERDGFSIGLQSTDLSENCDSIEEWLSNIKKTWIEINNLFSNNKEFLGIDSSIAPLFNGKSSLIHIIKKYYKSFIDSVTKDIYLKISNFIKKQNPNPVGLCGIMFPCLEDFELALEYEKGNFPIERNVFLSLHSGLGIDTYPIGIDESKDRVFEILSLLQGLSNKYKKPLSARFVSDGITKIGNKTDFKNQYLKDVVIRRL